jgi:hypothetical protein
VERHEWRVEPATTPIVVSLGPDASNSFKADIMAILNERPRPMFRRPAGAKLA